MGCEMINRREKLLEEKQYFVQQILDSVQQQQELKTEINDLECEQDRVFSEADSMVTDLGKTQQQNSTSAENELCQSKIQEQMVLIEELKQNDEKLKLDSRNLSLKLVNVSSEHNIATETISRLQNEIELLQGTIQDQKTGITELNDKCQDQLHLLKEKESLLNKEEGILVILRQSLIEKDQQIEFLSKQNEKATLLIPEERRRLLEEDDVLDFLSWRWNILRRKR
ncbi:unnamed protein product [Mytilus coruscus]|uniref:Uncharacterized protein n=1 Tax=Mytilus coruscus TaxID=42192 RepID=A0A6J8D4G3_MYTCO|nr:unnamed protein product [Mytilus coruscus]